MSDDTRLPLRTDQDYLRGEQYKDSRNLGARASLHRDFSTNEYGWQRWVFDRLEDLPAAARVLELGCGPAWLWRENLARVPAGWTITLTDLSPGMIAEAQQALTGSGKVFALDVVDAQSLPFEDATFDAVVANHMLYHVPDRAQALAEIARVLKPGGRLVAATNGGGHMQALFDLIGRFIGDVSAIAALISPDRISFRLENGADELAAHFARVERHDYEDTLAVAEVEPLVAYVASGITRKLVDLDDDLIDGFRAFVAQEMAANGGVIRIDKQSGLFVAHK